MSLLHHAGPVALGLVLLLAVSAEASAQTKAAPGRTISGFVSDAESGERLIGANILVRGAGTGTVTNSYGFYSLTMGADSLRLRFSYIGYESQFFEVGPGDDIRLDVALNPAAFGIEEVQVVAEREENSLETTQMSGISLPIAQVKRLPALLGEADVMKTLQLLPGVQSGGEGNSGLYVRGGGPDQNLVLLDGAPVYNPSHIFGFFSVFNADAIQHVQLTKGGFPARYGGRLSSVLDIRMKEGNQKKFEADGAIGLIFSKLTVQGPLVKDRASYLISGRRTYADLLARAFLKDESGDAPVFFFGDLNAKLNYQAGPKSRLFASFYTGTDAFGSSFTEEAEGGGTERFEGRLDWSNQAGTLRWNYLLSDKLFANTTLTYSRYLFDVGLRIEEDYPGEGDDQASSVTYRSGIRDVSGKVDFDYLPSPKHAFKFGGMAVRHTFNPGVGRIDEIAGSTQEEIRFTSDSTGFSGLEFYGYAEDDWALSRRLKVNVGLHASGMQVKGTFYGSIQPRMAVRVLVGDVWSAKASFGTMQQYLHLLTSTGIGLPTDLWVAATDRIRPQEAWQAAAGLTRAVPGGTWEVSVEGYYKDMRHLIEYVPGASFVGSSEDWQDKVTVGDGRSYGAEVFMERKRGRTTGWIGYALSWTDRTFPELNDGEAFPYRYDRRHDVSVVLTRRLSERWDLGAVWVYGTGNAVTLATGQFDDGSGSLGFSGHRLQDFGRRNGSRMGAYHRLDLSAQWHGDRHHWSLGAYNAYNRKNPFFYYASHVDNRNVYKQISLFPIVPSVTWSFHY